MVEITAIHQVGGIEHRHIESIRWRNPQSGDVGQSTRQEMVNWLNGSPQNRAYVTNGPVPAYVRARNDHYPPYIQTWADGIWQNNLLALPRY